MTKCSIYYVTDLETDTLLYIGRTIKSLELRLNQHKSKNRFGTDCQIRLLDEIESDNTEMWSETEIYWIRLFRDVNGCYTDNRKSAEYWGTIKSLEELGKSISKSLKGKPRPWVSKTFKGRKQSEAQKRKISESLKGIKRGELSDAHKMKLSKSLSKSTKEYWNDIKSIKEKFSVSTKEARSIFRTMR